LFALRFSIQVIFDLVRAPSDLGGQAQVEITNIYATLAAFQTAVACCGRLRAGVVLMIKGQQRFLSNKYRSASLNTRALLGAGK